MLIQSLLFFILGVASISWLLVLVFPLIWRKALYFAHKFVSAQIPLSLTEMQANYDFLCAQHAVELARNEQKYDSLQKKYAQQKIQLSKIKEQLYKLSLSAEHASYEKEAPIIESNQRAITTNSCIMEIKTMHEKIAHYKQRLQEIPIDSLDTATYHQLLAEIRKETKELAATLAAQIALQEGESSPINTLVQNSNNKNDLASRIREKITCSKKTPFT
ncbi:chromosome segregation ATPase [Bartonella japonica]|uniref:Chromosome segregation ATPase n=1 Tax=Bartonella japonica TaxID=357761 RepID=A0ABV2FPD1_9HYPH